MFKCQGILGTDLAIAHPVPIPSEIAAGIVVPIVGVDVTVVLRPIVIGRCNVVGGGTVVVHGTVETTVHLLGRDGGEIGGGGLSINH